MYDHQTMGCRHRPSTVIILVVASASVASACGSGAPSLLWSDYTRTCGAASDCTPIAVATECECPLCNNAAINQVDIKSYNDARAQYEAACKGSPCTAIACAAVTAYCDNGTCQVH